MFERLAELACAIEAGALAGLARLVKPIGEPLQAEQILSVAERSDHCARGAVRLDRLFSPEPFFSHFDRDVCLRIPVDGHGVDLVRDIVLPTPWSRSRLAAALAAIGTHKKSRAPRQDTNHDLMLVVPSRFAIVHGGRHSISAAKLGHEAALAPAETIDPSPVFGKLRCDGEAFVCRHSSDILAAVESSRMGALFEIAGMIGAHRQDAGERLVDGGGGSAAVKGFGPAWLDGEISLGRARPFVQ